MPARLAAELRALSAQPAAHPPAGPSASPAETSLGLHGEIYPVHRLDQAVGGVMVYARTKQAAAALSRAIQEGRMEKEYLAVLTKPMAEPHGTLRDLLYHDRVKNKTYVVKRKRNGVKEAVLDYETLASGVEGTLIRVHLHTGRTHQIRVQFAARGCPLAGRRKVWRQGQRTAALVVPPLLPRSARRKNANIRKKSRKSALGSIIRGKAAVKTT